jgi:hypothetical protein
MRWDGVEEGWVRGWMDVGRILMRMDDVCRCIKGFCSVLDREL